MAVEEQRLMLNEGRLKPVKAAELTQNGGRGFIIVGRRGMSVAYS